MHYTVLSVGLYGYFWAGQAAPHTCGCAVVIPATFTTGWEGRGVGRQRVYGLLYLHIYRNLQFS
jgi:hypothetical protein